jgi:parvulin-like peptidyl-prolyl isomerase
MPSFRFLSIALLASFLVTAVSCGKGGDPLVKVGRAQITDEDLETLARVNPRLKPRLGTPQGRQKVLENYVEQEMLYQESVNRGLNRAADLKDKIALYEKILVAQALLDTELEKKVKEYYDAHKDEFERVKVAHILIRAALPEPAKADEKDARKKDAKKPAATKRSEAEALKLAESVRDRLTKGEDFGKLAKELSEDDRTKSSMGDLGYITVKDRRLERWGWLPVAEKAFVMKAGEVSEPIKTQDGFHVVKVLEEKKEQPLEEAEAGIKFRLQADIRTTLLDDLKKKYKVEYLSQKDGASPAPVAPEAPGASAAPVEPAAPAPSAPATGEPAAPAEPTAPATN